MAMSRTLQNSSNFLESSQAPLQQNFRDRIERLSDVLIVIQKDVVLLKQQFLSIKEDKQRVKQSLYSKAQETKNMLTAKLLSFQEIMIKDLESNKGDLKTLELKVTKLRGQQIESQKKLIAIQRRIHDLEVHLGS